MINWAIIILLVIIGGYDLLLVFTHRPTISQAYQAIFPTPFDLALLVIFLFILCSVVLHPTLRVILAALMGHLFWPNKETWNE